MSNKSPLLRATERLRRNISGLRFKPPVHHVYNPFTYAWEPYREYLERFAQGNPEVLIIGMNPSYFGMVQTGIPFGDAKMVREWLGITAPVRRPRSEHPRRPIEGPRCTRADMSGRQLWEWARDCFGTPEKFFARFFVVNYCPLCFLEKSGANLTADKLPAAQRAPLFAACDDALRATTEALDVRYAIGLGRFAERRVLKLLGDAVVCGGAPHPSPANTPVRLTWAAEMNRALVGLGVRLNSSK